VALVLDQPGAVQVPKYVCRAKVNFSKNDFQPNVFLCIWLSAWRATSRILLPFAEDFLYISECGEWVAR
jgi:hypothetical protein